MHNFCEVGSGDRELHREEVVVTDRTLSSEIRGVGQCASSAIRRLVLGAGIVESKTLSVEDREIRETASNF